MTADKIRTVNQAPPVALEDASLTAWIGPRDGTEAIYYPKGSLAGLMLDVHIRDATDNRASLDDVMRALYRDTFARSGSGFTNEDWWATVREVAGNDVLGDFHERYVDGRDPYPWDQLLPIAGLRLEADSTRVPRMGVNLDQQSGNALVTGVVPGSSAAEAGVLVGDRLLRIGMVTIAATQDWLEEFRLRYRGAAPGTPYELVVQRDGEEIVLQGGIGIDYNVAYRIVEDPRASFRAQQIREGLLTGSVNPN